MSGLSKMYDFNVNRGQSPAEADLNLLETARRCELYGMKMHPAKVSIIIKKENLYTIYILRICKINLCLYILVLC